MVSKLYKWKIIRKWSTSRRRNITVHTLIRNENMIGYVMKGMPPESPHQFWTLYSGDREWARSVGVADTLVEAKNKLRRLVK